MRKCFEGGEGDGRTGSQGTFKGEGEEEEEEEEGNLSSHHLFQKKNIISENLSEATELWAGVEGDEAHFARNGRKNLQTLPPRGVR